MSVFDFPRINVHGTIRLNPGTANNDDYAASATLPDSWQALAGEPLGLIDSKNVAARTYGMSDDNFIAWVQKAQTFLVPDGKSKKKKSQEIIPAEWNYYGDMSMQSVSIQVVGAQAGASGVKVEDCVGAELTLTGGITDINPEGSPPATQFFIEQLTLGSKDSPLIRAGLSKGVGQWINFYRNVNIQFDGGAGSYVYHALAGATVDIPGWKRLRASGVVFRYYLYRAQLVNPEGGTNAGIEKLYEKQKTNPKDLELVGTFAPLYARERIVAAPTGRLMTWDKPNIKTPTQNNNGGGTVALGPAVLHRSGSLLTADFSGTFPDDYDEKTGTNPKFDFGPVKLMAVKGSRRRVVGSIDYADTAAGNARGWLFDFDLSARRGALERLVRDPKTTLRLVSRDSGEVLAEVDYYFVSNQQAIYGQQHGSGELFLNNGTTEPARVSVFRRGVELSPGDCPPITVWQYRSVPLQSPGDALPIATDFKPGEPLRVDTRQPGNFLFTFTINDAGSPPPSGYPPKSYSTFMNPPWVTNAPQISLRILPNEDYDRYYVDPSADEPVANELLTFDVVYDHVLRVYYLLYPVMRFLPLNSPTAVAQNAEAILARTDPSIWLSKQYMPRTRDLSDSRRRLLQAWCRRALLRQQARRRPGRAAP